MTKNTKKIVGTLLAALIAFGLLSLLIDNYKIKKTKENRPTVEQEVQKMVTYASNQTDKEPAESAEVEDKAGDKTKEIESKKPDSVPDQSKVPPKVVEQKPVNSIAAAPLKKALVSDFSLGKNDAPVVIIAYESLSCPHCAQFHKEAFEQLKSEYIDTGKVRFIHRDFPLNRQGLVASMFAHCWAEQGGGDKNQHYYSLVRVLFEAQDSWAIDPKYTDKIKSIAALDGMSKEKFDACIKDTELQNRLLKVKLDAYNSLQIKSVPTFLINNEVIEGYADFGPMKKAIDKELVKKSQKKLEKPAEKPVEQKLPIVKKAE